MSEKCRSFSDSGQVASEIDIQFSDIRNVASRGRSALAHNYGSRANVGECRSQGLPRKRSRLRRLEQGKGASAIAHATGLTRQTVLRIKEDPATAEKALAAWRL
nr:helix-turn-helix domain-containing protein [Mesorhizobium sp.]